MRYCVGFNTINLVFYMFNDNLLTLNQIENISARVLKTVFSASCGNERTDQLGDLS